MSGVGLAAACATSIIGYLSSRGENASGAIGNNTFGGNTVTVSQGSGSYTYAWVVVYDDGGGTWVVDNPTLPTGGPRVISVGSLTTTVATIACDVTDTATGAVTRSQLAFYSYQRTT